MNEVLSEQFRVPLKGGSVKKQGLRIVLLFLGISLFSYSVSAACSFSIDKTRYAPGESIFYTMLCTLLSEQFDPYSLAIYNSTGSLTSTVIGVTGQEDEYFYDEDTIPVQWTNQTNAYVNFTVDGTVRQRIYFNVSGLNARDLFLTSPVVLYGGAWYWNEMDAISSIVTDYEGHAVANAICKIDVSDSISGEPFYTQNDVWTSSIGKIVFAIDVDYSIFDIGAYSFKISCMTTSESIDVYDGEVAHIASGHVSGIFNVNDFIVNVSVYMASGMNETKTQFDDNICVNFTNNYRDYADAYIIRYELLCDVPNQDVKVFQHMGGEVVSANSVGIFCPPIKIPERSSLGTGYCYAKVDIVPANLGAEFAGDYMGTSDLFYVLPSFAVGGLAYKSSQTSFYAEFYMQRDMPNNSLIRIVIPKEIENAWNFDKVESVYMVYNGSRYDGLFTTGERTMVDNYGIFAEGIETTFEIWVFITNQSVLANEPMYIYATGYSEANFWQNLIAVLQEIRDAILASVGFSGIKGSYNVSSVAPTVLGTEDLIINYSITANNMLAERKKLHFHYDFAKIVNGIEQNFKDQNPYRADYQGIETYQTMMLNESKNISILLKPYLDIGNYAVYGYLTDADPLPGAGESINFTQRMILNVTVDKVPDFDGIYGPDVLLAIS